MRAGTRADNGSEKVIYKVTRPARVNKRLFKAVLLRIHSEYNRF